MGSKTSPIKFLRRELTESYEPSRFESTIYKEWIQSGCFAASDQSISRPTASQKSFCIVIPPPNVTGILHMGHALTNTIQDILTRWRRMKGDNTLWLPGTDHAGIATQAQVEKAITQEGKGPSGRPLTRHDMGREKFIERTWKWKEEHHGVITSQLMRLGSSLDWERERFTMDEGFSQAVVEAFVRLYEDGLIYRGERVINWCTRCMTALSDLEVVPTDRKGSLWHIRYFIINREGRRVVGSDGSYRSVVIATTRPETLLGDTAIAVHPEDERYSEIHGLAAELPLLERRIPVITDPYVDREFGTGALKVTPAHDFNDYDLGQKHSLATVSVMGKNGKITTAGGPYAGLKFSEARERVVQDLKEKGLLVKTEDHALKLGLCQRCDSVAEPVMSKQWFVKIESLARPAIEAVEGGRIEFTPKNWEKTYFEWMRNIRDWCISRQLWWGHQIPAWYCKSCQTTMVARETPACCSSCGEKELEQDEDVLDTWFSSGLWPFATLGWPAKTPVLATFYPTSILETGFDIIFFWVARMIMMGLYFMKEVPFRKVYLHAMVRDEKGEKMSKSKGNVIDPLEVIDKHGADPLRFTFAVMAGQGRDIKLSIDRVAGYQAFCNKLWNATRFFHFQTASGLPKLPPEGLSSWIDQNRVQFSAENKWILSRLDRLTETVERGFEQFEINGSAQALYDFCWHEFCDWYVEFCKIALRKGSSNRNETLYVFHYALEHIFALLHPIIPFVTEELWRSLPWISPANTPARIRDSKPKIETLMFQPFPSLRPAFRDEVAEGEISCVQVIVEAIRNFRGENRVPPKARFPVGARALKPESQVLLERHREVITALAQISSISLSTDKIGNQESLILLPEAGLELRISLDGLVDIAEESRRLNKEAQSIRSDLEHVRKKLLNPTFVDKAPPALVEKERAKELALETKLTELAQAQARLGAK